MSVGRSLCEATRPSHVNIDRMIVRPRAQAAQHKVHRVFG